MLCNEAPLERVQAVRPVYTTGTSTTPASSQTDVVHVDIRSDSTGRDIILWQDILIAFKNATHIRHGSRIVPFLTDNDFNTLKPLRIAAIPNAVMDVYVEDQSSRSSEPATHSTTVFPPPPEYTQTPEYDITENHLNDDNPVAIAQPLSSSSCRRASQISVEESTGSIIEDIADIVLKARQGDTTFQVKLATAYKDGTDGLPQDYKLAMKWFLKAAECGDPSAQWNAGLLLENGQGIPRDSSQAAEWYLKSASQGLASAQFNLGRLYNRGQGLSRYPSKAMEWYLKAADQGHTEAQFNIGFMYDIGHGVPQDDAKSTEWYLKAALNGHAPAQLQIATLYHDGDGVPKDYSRAAEWYLKAAHQGEGGAQLFIGTFHIDGCGVDKDYAKAMEWLLRSAKQRYGEAEYYIGYMYEKGLGVARDYDKAMEWFSKAERHGISQSDIVHVDIHPDATGRDIILWEDILIAFKNATHIRHESRVVRFLKDSDFTLKPLWIAAIPNAVLDVYVEGVQTESAQYSAIQSLSPAPTVRNPEYDPMDIANTLLKEFDIPTMPPRMLQSISNDNSEDFSDDDDSAVIITQPLGSINNVQRSPQLYVDISEIIATAHNGDSTAQVKLAIAYKHGTSGLSHNYQSAMGWFLKAACQGDPSAQVNVGLMYEYGQGVPQDYPQAMSWYLKAADQGYAEAQFNIGLMYYNGRGVSRDYSRVMEWYLQAADQGFADAQFNIGVLYSIGQGVRLDHATAMDWYLRAAAQGLAEAQVHIGLLYSIGQGVSQDYNKAMDWYHQAAEQGDPAAQYNIGIMYYYGRGISRDYAKAMEWNLRAASQGYGPAQKIVGIIMKKQRYGVPDHSSP
ncbi:hypothetical protein BGX23_005278 [Mortierella sp. AD031]|nr:hypothetical protein BGX23_005278 [Mortierella sp. AD031]